MSTLGFASVLVATNGATHLNEECISGSVTKAVGHWTRSGFNTRWDGLEDPRSASGPRATRERTRSPIGGVLGVVTRSAGANEAL